MANVFTDEQVNEILRLFMENSARQQYIGARYVPIFGRKGESSIEWDGGAAPYEPLTIVLYQGNSFTSRQYVPAGIEITNAEFWANTGNYNAQVEQYRQEVLKYAQEVESIALGYCKCFNTVLDMKTDADIEYGMTVKTNGFNSIGDGGGAFYKIENAGTPDERTVISCKNGLYAKLVVQPSVTLEMFGAFGNATNDDTEAINYAFEYVCANGIAIEGCGNKIYLASQLNINGIIKADFKNSTFRAKETVENFLTWKNGETEESTYDPNFFGGYIKNFRIDGSGLAQRGFYLLTGKRQYISNVEVWNCEVGYRVASANESNLDTIRFFNCAIGIENATYDCQFNNVYGRFSKIGILSTGNLTLNTGHIWVDEGHGFDGSIGLEFTGRATLTNFYFDSYQTAIKPQNSSYALYLCSCKIIFGFEGSKCFDLENDPNNGSTIYLVNSYIDIADGVSSYKLTTVDQNICGINYVNSRITNADSFNPLPNIPIEFTDYLTNVNLKAFKLGYMVYLYGSATIQTEIPLNTSTKVLEISGTSGNTALPLEQYAYPIYASNGGAYGNPGSEVTGCASLKAINNGCEINVSLAKNNTVGSHLRFALAYPIEF